MSYEKLGFVSGQKLKAEHLNHMEDGISALSGEVVGLDTTLTQSGKAADAKAVGDALSNLSKDIFVPASGDGVPSLQVEAKDGDMLNVFSTISNTRTGVDSIYLCQRSNANYLPKIPVQTKSVKGLTVTVAENGTINFSGTPTAAGATDSLLTNVPFVIGARYLKTFSNTSIGNLVIGLKQDDTTLKMVEVSSKTHDLQTLIGKTVNRINFYESNGQNNVDGAWVQLVLTDNPDLAAYEEANAEWKKANIGQTVYGGSFDWGTGHLTVTHDANGQLSAPEYIELPSQPVIARDGTNYLTTSTGNTGLNGLVAPAEAIRLLDRRIAELEGADYAPNMMQYTHIPRLCVYGDTTGMTKDDAKIMSFVYHGAQNYINASTGTGRREDGIQHDGYVKMKWQGTSSIAFPKKNFTITAYSDADCSAKMPITLREKWGAQSKYCLKANFIDSSQCRNVLAAKLWGECVACRDTASESYIRTKDTPNYAAVDGYPILLFINDAYQGLYTLNIPKDEWMFAMKDKEGVNAVVCSEGGGQSPYFKAPAVIDENDWSFEVNPADKPSAVTSFNRIYAAVALPESSDAEITAKKSALEACMDIDSVIDYAIFLDRLCLTDNQGKNMIVATYDNVKWFVSAYDLDTAFGNHWSGAAYNAPNNMSGIYSANLLITTVLRLYASKYTSRKAVLHSGCLSASNMLHKLFNFTIDVPQEAYMMESKLWPDMCGANVNGMSQIANFILARNV